MYKRAMLSWRAGVFVAGVIVAEALGVACNTVLGIGDFITDGCPAFGARRCMNSTTPQLCGADGQWRSEPMCVQQTCAPSTGLCIGECVVEEKGCSGTTPQKCDADGHWRDEAVQCQKGCYEGQCMACTPGDGQKQCLGNMPQSCDDTGNWVDILPEGCVDQTCNAGICVGQCAPGKQCSGSTPQTCDSNGLWQDGPICDTPCRLGCDPTTGECSITSDSTVCDDGDVCTPSESCQTGICAGGSDHAWAHWEIKADPPSKRYAWTVDVVYDNVTRLSWQRKVPASTYNWDDAKKYCECLNGAASGVECNGDKIAEYPSGWRVPTRIELASIVDSSKLAPAIDQVAFPSTPPEYFWSSSAYVVAADGAWAVYFHDGIVYNYNVGLTYRVRCVR